MEGSYGEFFCMEGQEERGVVIVMGDEQRVYTREVGYMETLTITSTSCCLHNILGIKDALIASWIFIIRNLSDYVCRHCLINKPSHFPRHRQTECWLMSPSSWL